MAMDMRRWYLLLCGMGIVIMGSRKGCMLGGGRQGARGVWVSVWACLYGFLLLLGGLYRSVHNQLVTEIYEYYID